MKNKLFTTLILVFFLSGFLILSACNHKSNYRRALFSWSANEILEGPSELFQTMTDLQLDTLYQSFSSTLGQEDIQSFLVNAKKSDISVNLLDGDPRWALQRDGQAMIKVIDRLIQINRHLDKNTRIKTVIFDVEPYLLDQWNNQTNEKIMDDFVVAMTKAYQVAHENNLEMIICIPYFYDNMGFSEQLEDLIESACDSIAIMNYYKGKEIPNITLEVALAHKYKKQVITIYEVQAPGSHDLEDKNTYYHDGISAIDKNFKNLQAEFYDETIFIAFHEYRALKEILSRDFNN